MLAADLEISACATENVRTNILLVKKRWRRWVWGQRLDHNLCSRPQEWADLPLVSERGGSSGEKQENVAAFKERNIKRHFPNKHADHAAKCTQEREIKKKAWNCSNVAVVLLYKLAKQSQAFSGGQYARLEGTSALCQKSSNLWPSSYFVAERPSAAVDEHNVVTEKKHLITGPIKQLIRGQSNAALSLLHFALYVLWQSRVDNKCGQSLRFITYSRCCQSCRLNSFTRIKPRHRNLRQLWLPQKEKQDGFVRCRSEGRSDWARLYNDI